MASNSIHAGQPGPVLNYLGHPCKLAPMIERRAGWPEWDRLKVEDQRSLAQQLGRAMAEQEDRIGNAMYAAERLVKMAAEGADHLEIEGIADMLREYLLHTSNHAFNTGTLALATMHRADLIAPSQQQRAEAVHG